MVRLALGLNTQTLRWLSQAREASDDQQTILDVGMNHQQTDDPSPESDPCVPGLEHDNAPLSHTAEFLASTTLSSVDSMPMQVHSPQCIMYPHVCAAELEPPAELDNISTRDLVPSPTPSEQGSLHRSCITLESHVHPEGRPPLSPSTSESSAGYFSGADPSSTPSSPLSESSIVFVTAESVPEYLRENRAYLVATSAPSRPSSAASSYIRLPSVTTSLDSMPPQEDPDLVEASLADAPTNGSSRLHCRICLRDPCEDLTATMCGHVFCNRSVVPIWLVYLRVDAYFYKVYHRCRYDQVCVPSLQRSHVALLSFPPSYLASKASLCIPSTLHQLHQHNITNRYCTLDLKPVTYLYSSRPSLNHWI